MVAVSALCIGLEDHPPEEGPNGEMEGAADSVSEAVVRAEVDAGRELGTTDAGAATEAEAVREGAVGTALRMLDDGETPLKSSSSGINRWA